ncbi:putative ribonuclease H-like domain-containing protein [Tanacetum coccineum]|uniref:Ribonuclease H-like domain-containing protein n=1 Tax=Tanacetum coccineum TaxID=301880 RepID=A0ABQ5HK27_9ASTR
MYTFKEGDFKRLHLNYIEDMLLLFVQNKLHNLDTNVVVHLAVNLRMFARRSVIQARVEDLQLGVESYQKKLNLTKPKTRDVDMSRRLAYTTLLNPQGVFVPTIQPELEGSTRDIPLDRIEVHRYDKKEKKGEMRTKTELTLEQTQQGVSDEVLNYLKEQTLYKLKLKIYSKNDPTSGIRACVETLNKKNLVSMRMRQYICHTDHNLWDVIVNGDLEEEPAPTRETFAPPAPKTAKQLVAKRNQERVKSILLLAIPEEFLVKFHNVTDAKSLWEAIKSRFGGNEESKKMQKNVLKHQFENFSTASNESLDKAYDRFQKLISQLEVHGAPISKEDINQKFLRSLPPSWNQIALIMRNKPDIDEIDIDDLYNNLRVYEDEMKRSSSSTSTSQNLAFLSSENTSSTNEVSTASGDFGVSTAGGISQVSSTPCAHDVACSFFAQPTTSPQLENEDFQQIDEDDLEELDLRWQVAMLTVRVKKFIQKTGRNLDFKEKRPVSLDKSKIKCYNCHRIGHFARDCRSRRNQGKRSYGDNGRSNTPTNKSSSQALVAQDGLEGYDWSTNFELKAVNYALMAISSSSSSSSSDNEGYELALESLESRILGHEKNELAWGEKYEFQNYELKCREIKINNLKMELEKVVKERDELKVKIEKWEESSKNLDNEISLRVFYVRSSNEENTPANDSPLKQAGFHAVPKFPPNNSETSNPPRVDISFAGLDEYAIRKKIIESKTTNLNTKTSETVGKTNEANTQKPKTVYESVNKDKVIIEDWNSDDEDDVYEVQTVSPVKTNETQTVKTKVDKIGQSLISTDISKITRKPSKTGKHGHGKRKSTREARNAKPKPGKGETSLKHSHWPLPTRRTHVDSKENTRGSGICTKLSAKEAQGVTITDCQAGNPCELRYDPTAHRWHPMIEE